MNRSFVIKTAPRATCSFQRPGIGAYHSFTVQVKQDWKPLGQRFRLAIEFNLFSGCFLLDCFLHKTFYQKTIQS